MDLVFIKPVSIIPLSGAAIAGNVITVSGSGLSRAFRFLVNNVTAPEFVITSNTSAIITVPYSVQGTVITTITAVGDSDSVAVLDLSIGKQKATSSLYVVQRLLRNLLTKNGSDAFNTSSGADIKSLIGNAKDIEVSIITSVRFAVSELKRTQTAVLPAAATLADASVISVSFDKLSGTAVVELKVTTGDGKQLDTGFVVAG